jgi:hypothetical protein
MAEMAAPLALPLLFVLTAAAAIVTGCGATTVAYNDRAVVIDGQRRIILSGSIHYPRSTPQVRSMDIYIPMIVLSLNAGAAI